MNRRTVQGIKPAPTPQPAPPTDPSLARFIARARARRNPLRRA